MGALKLDVPVRKPRRAGAAATAAGVATAVAALRRRLAVSAPSARRIRAARAMAISAARAA
jgi:hypothetical protein